MKIATYNEIVELIHSHGTRDCIKSIGKLYPTISQRTLGSIYSQEYQKRMKKCHHKFHTAKSKDRLYQWYLDQVKDGGEHVLLKISDNIGMSPSLLARMILECHLQRTRHAGEAAPTKSILTQMIKDTTLIEDPHLAHEVHSNLCSGMQGFRQLTEFRHFMHIGNTSNCVLSDDVYGPLVDSIKHSIGHEHEFLLQRKLNELGIACLDEDQMRVRGYDKTPDFKLEVPIAVDGHVVNWVESKASFGDEDSHRTYLKDQFWSYWNRFGPGLVIYWFGFIDELDVNQDKGIMLMDHFPENIVFMKPAAPRQ